MGGWGRGKGFQGGQGGYKYIQEGGLNLGGLCYLFLILYEELPNQEHN